MVSGHHVIGLESVNLHGVATNDASNLDSRGDFCPTKCKGVFRSLATAHWLALDWFGGSPKITGVIVIRMDYKRFKYNLGDGKTGIVVTQNFGKDGPQLWNLGRIFTVGGPDGCACHVAYVIAQIVGGSNDAFLIVGIDVNGSHFPFINDWKGLRNLGECDVILNLAEAEAVQEIWQKTIRAKKRLFQRLFIESVFAMRQL